MKYAILASVLSLVFVLSFGIAMTLDTTDNRGPTTTIPAFKGISTKTQVSGRSETITRTETVVVTETEKSYIEKFIERNGWSHKPKKKHKKFEPDL